MQAELRSIAAAFRAPSSSAIRDGVFGHIESTVKLPSKMRSRSIGSRLAAAKARRAATTAMSEKLQCSIRRSRIPVREVIHSSLVSINVVRS